MAHPQIAKVTLYKHGIASFERQATVENDQNIELHFKQEEMNDVLKSLTVMDTSGCGNISSISYDNNKSIDQRKSESPFSMASSPDSILSIISELRGVEVSLVYDDIPITGVIVSTAETHTSSGKVGYITLWHDNALRVLSLLKTSSFTVNDPRIQYQLNEAMNIQRESKIKGQKTVSISTTGKGNRQIKMSYFIEAPIWKVSYRVIIPDAIPDADKACEDFILQGWAIVDNITEEPWKDVQLTLISGEPHSCDVDLFNPIFKKKKNEPIQPTQPVQHQYPANVLSNRNFVPQQQMMNSITNLLPNAAPESENEGKTSTKELGDLFQYDIVHPVTVASNQSALVPIVDKKVSGSRVALYNREKHNSHPHSAILLVNTTGLTLEGGPCAVIESNTFVGECVMKTVQPSETRFIEYATEISMDIWATDTSTSKFASCTIKNASLNMVQKVRYITTYNLRNKSSKDISVYIEHRFRKDCVLVDTPEPTNPKPITFCIFKAKATANSTNTFVVIEEKTNSHVESLRNISSARLGALAREGLGKDEVASIDSYLALLELKSQKQTLLNSVAASIKKIYENHTRIRGNLSSLTHQGSSAENLRKKYIFEMEKDETRLAELEQQGKELEEEMHSISEEAESIVVGIRY